MLGAGGILAYPTDTYYGLGCDLSSRKTVERLYELKKRDRQKPLSLIVADLTQLSRYALVSNFAFRAIKRMTPGPFTFVLPATKIVPELLVSKQKQVGIRLPDAPVAAALAAGLGWPLVTTSATDEDGLPLIDAKDIKATLGHGLDLILDGGVHPSEPSTIVSLIDDRIEILRQGKGRVLGE